VQILKLLIAGEIEVAEPCDRLEFHEPVLVRRVARGQHDLIHTINIPQV
jgi:hypothetical protein